MANDNPLSGLANGLAQGLQIGQQRKALQLQTQNNALEMQMKMAKDQYDKISHQSDQLGSQIMSGKVPDALMGPMYNQWAAYQKITNPGMSRFLPNVKDVTPQDSEIMKQMATVVMFGKQQGLDPKLVQSGLQDLYNKAMSSSNVSNDFGKSMTEFMTNNFGTQPQTLTSGNTVTQGTVNAFGQATPLTMTPPPTPGQPAKPGAPIQQPNIPLANQQLAETKRFDDLAKEFSNRADIQDLVKSQSSSKELKALITSNPKGASGVIAQQLGHSAGDQRVVETDIQRYSGSPDVAARALRAWTKVTTGTLSKTDQNDLDALVSVMQKSSEQRLAEKADSYTTSILGDKAPKDQYESLKNRLTGAVAGPSLSEQDKAAIQWAKSNPKDPRAKKILSLHPGQ